MLSIATLVGALAHPLLTGAALATGFLNTMAGGGAIVTFLTLTAVGVPALTAHVTSQFVTPASFLPSLLDLATTPAASRPQPPRALLLAGMAGTLGGVAILAVTPPGTFRAIAPFVLIPAGLLIPAQALVQRRGRRSQRGWPTGIVVALMVLCGLYAGLIGVGTGTLTLVTLGLAAGFRTMPLSRVLRIRNVILLGMSLTVSLIITATRLVDWDLVVTLIAPGVLGGWVGTRMMGRLPVPLLQGLIVVTAIAGGIWLALTS